MPIQLESPTVCEWCDTRITVYGTGRPKRFCSASCRDEAWREQKKRMPGRNERRCTECYLVHAGECI